MFFSSTSMRIYIYKSEQNISDTALKKRKLENVQNRTYSITDTIETRELIWYGR